MEDNKDPKTPPEGVQDPWLGGEETYTKTIAGKEVTFRAKPLTRHFKALIENTPKDAETQNYLLMKSVVTSPDISRESWDNLWVFVKSEIMAEVAKVTGAISSFPVRG